MRSQYHEKEAQKIRYSFCESRLF